MLPPRTTNRANRRLRFLQFHSCRPGPLLFSCAPASDEYCTNCCVYPAASTFEDSTCRSVVRKTYSKWQKLWRRVPAPLNTLAFYAKLTVRLSLRWLRHLPKPPFTDQDTSVLIDLHKATKLRQVMFRCGPLNYGCGWVIASLKTITTNHQDLQQISIQLPYCPRRGRHCRTIIERGKTLRNGMQWSDLDSLLVQFWESRSIRLRVVCFWTSDGIRARDWAVYLLPEATKREEIAQLLDELSYRCMS